MSENRRPGKLAVILHADIAGSTALVQQDEHLAHERIQDTFRRFGDTIGQYHGRVRELRGDALLAEFERASDAVTAALAFQADQVEYTSQLNDNILPIVRVGIALGEVVIADNTITGAGVVLAQRLEQLAEPAGLCISSAIREALPARLPFQYGLLGEQKVKGFDEPVRVFFVALGDEATMPAPEPHQPIPSAQPPQQGYKSRWLLGMGALALIVAGLLYWLKPWEPTVEPADLAKMAYALPDKPSVAVLPFENMSKDEEQEYFSDGITEDIITDLSKVSGLFVAAPGSTFAYKGSPVKIRQVAEDLGVRYVLEGSVQRSDDRIRVNVKLIDAVKGDHIWAERFDRKLEDVFLIQSEVAQRVAKALAVTIKAGEHERLFLKHTASIDAYDQFLRARRLVDSPSKGDVRKAELLFKRAIELDPNFASAYAGLSFNYSVKVRFRFSDSPDADKQRALEFASKAIGIDPELAWGHIALGGAHLANGDPDAAVEAVRHALTLQPNSYAANLFMGLYLQFAGESAQAVEHLELAQRLNPVDTVRKLSFLGMAYFMNGDYAESAAIWKKRLEKFPASNVIGFVFLAGSYALLDRMEDASSAKEALLKLKPEFYLSDWRWPRTYKKSENYQRLYDAAIKAGIPEHPPLKLPDKPSIAVLPFTNMSGDPEQEYFADGITEDIITELSRFKDLFVISRTSSFAYKDKNVKVQDIGHELGVRYLLEGSVRRSGKNLRVTAQLIEAQTGRHIWAERYDRQVDDIFAIQDEINGAIVTTLGETLWQAAAQEVARKPTSSFEAYDFLLKANEALHHLTKDDNLEARDFYRKALEFDTEFAGPYRGLAWTYLLDFITQWVTAGEETLDRAVEYTNKAIVLEPDSAGAHRLLGRISQARGHYDEALAQFERALELNPNDGDIIASYGGALVYAGRSDEGITWAKEAVRRNPHHPDWYTTIIALGYYFAGRYDDTLLQLNRIERPRMWDHRLLAAAYAQLGNQTKAREHVAAILAINPEASISTIKPIAAFKNAADVDRYLEGLRKAGLPE